MLSEEFIQTRKNNLTELGNQLHKEVLFSKEFMKKNIRPENEREWFSSVNSVCNYGTFLIQNLIKQLEDYKRHSEEQISYYIGKIAIQTFLDIINAFELSTNKLIDKNKAINGLLNNRIEKKISIIESSWKSEVNSKSRDLKKSLISTFNNKRREMKFIRDTLKTNSIIDPLDYKILEFAWDIRNSMHNNFLAIKDMNFSSPQTSLNYSFEFKKGEELYHPHDLKSFYMITEQIIFIQLRILQRLNKLDENNNKS